MTFDEIAEQFAGAALESDECPQCGAEISCGDRVYLYVQLASGSVLDEPDDREWEIEQTLCSEHPATFPTNRYADATVGERPDGRLAFARVRALDTSDPANYAGAEVYANFTTDPEIVPGDKQ